MAATETKVVTATVKIHKADAIAFLEDVVGSKTAAKMAPPMLAQKLKNLKGKINDDTETNGKDNKKTLNALLDAFENNDKIEVTGGDEPAEEEEAPKGKKGAKPAAAPAKKGAATNGKATSAKKKDPNADSDSPGPARFQKVGITQVIKNELAKASKSDPVTKAEILAVLVKKFGPDTDAGRTEEAMKKTVNGQLLYNLGKAGIEVHRSKDGKGFWIDKKHAATKD